MPEVSKEDIDGLGGRVTATEICAAGIVSRTMRNEQDIQKIFDRLGMLPYWIIGSVLVPTVLIIYQIASNKGV